jgi:hypothetical protein
MRVLRDKFKRNEPVPVDISLDIITRLENEIIELKKRLV